MGNGESGCKYDREKKTLKNLSQSYRRIDADTDAEASMPTRIDDADPRQKDAEVRHRCRQIKQMPTLGAAANDADTLLKHCR